MPQIISEIYSAGSNGEYRVRRDTGRTLTVYAKDELDAYTKGLAYIKEEEKEMRTLTICITLGVLFFLSAITVACEQKREHYAANMKHCVAAGKSYVSEDASYSCRDADAVPKDDGERG
jgi:hypothetical protein